MTSALACFARVRGAFAASTILTALLALVPSCGSSGGDGAPGDPTTNGSPADPSPEAGPPACSGECKSGATESEACAWGSAKKTRTCSPACAWAAWSECAKPKGWRPMASPTSAGISGRFGHSAFWTGKEMLVFGGSTGTGQVVSSWGAYDPDKNTWRKLPPPPATIKPGNLEGPAYPVMGDGALFVSFGLGGAIFDLKTETWSEIPSATTSTPLERRAPAVVAWVPETKEFVAWGGGRTNCPCSLADGGAYSPVTKTWRKIAPSPLDARDHIYRPGGIAAGGKVIIFGGGTNSGGRYRDAAAYDPKLDTWTKLPDAPAELRSYNVHDQPLGSPATKALFWAGNQLSGSASGYASNSGAIWDTATNAWTAIAGPAGERDVDGFADGATFIAGNILYAWGGNRYHTMVNTGYAYDVSSKAWSAMDAGGPSPRTLPSGVWTGSEAIVWGGRNGGPLDDGAIWRP